MAKVAKVSKTFNIEFSTDELSGLYTLLYKGVSGGDVEVLGLNSVFCLLDAMSDGDVTLHNGHNFKCFAQLEG
jgi:DUF4097 and DUF4098 domain-containing protein YvlB